MDEYYWWYAYGRFAPGEENLPLIGDVIRYYLSISGWSIKEAAKRLEYTERYLKMLISERNRAMPQLLSRRIFLAKALRIPPVLLGLSSVTLYGWGDGSTLSTQVAHAITDGGAASAETMLECERMLGMSWELYYTSTVQKAAVSIEENLQKLVSASINASGVKKDQYDAMLCRFYQLSSLVARDQMQFTRSVEDEYKAVEIAFRLKNAELIASSLLRRARIYIRQKDYVLAYQDAMQMLPYADLSRDPLKGKCYQMAGEATGYIGVNDLILQKKSMDYFNKALRIAQKGDMTPDGSFVRTDITSILIEKADALILFGRIADAHDALAMAREHLSPEQNRWKINLLLSEARAYLAERNVTNCCRALIEAMSIIRAINLSAKKDRVLSLLEECRQLDPQNPEVQQLEMLFSSRRV
jgi:tetratricopeptide (TPR) repeat protein